MSKIYGPLIIFILTIGSLTACGTSNAVSNKQPIVVSIDHSGQVYLQENKVDLQDLAPKLKAMTGNNFNTQIYVRGDKDVSYGRIMEVLSAISASGFKNAALAAKTPNSDNLLRLEDIDVIRRQLTMCWNMPVDARDAKNLVVEVSITVNPDRTVQSAEVVDKARMATDPLFRAAAESALRALYNPRCTPLELPEGKYEQWKTIDFTFDPRQML